MKFFLIVIVFTFYFDCYAQTKFKTVVDEKKNQPMLIGVIDRSNLMDSSFIHWFNEEYEYYAVDTTLVKTFKDELENVKITIVMGTWCSDSRREVPHLLKIFDFLNFPKESYEIIAVDRKKQALTHIESLNIKLVPTIIVYKNSNEIGRIIETPKETLEKDLEQIILSN